MRGLLLWGILGLVWSVLVWPVAGLAQSRTVAPGELGMTVTVIDQEVQPYTREMVMILIRGVYRRHITREILEQPDLEGFNWTQLGPDQWGESRINGQKVKVLERRMALYPERSGPLTIGSFVHHLTLTDETDDWFEHDIRSEPLTIDVAAAPVQAGQGWWFPAKSIKVSDQWSNAPDQLKAGEGVLRIVRIEALGVTPEMIPPMPDLTSPSAMIFPHPEKRLVDLTPEGPMTYAFWRWTIRPTNDRSAIVEPLSFQYYDTRSRVMRDVTISAQRVAFDTVELPPVLPPAKPVRLPGWPVALVALVVFGASLAAMLWGRGGLALADVMRRVPLVDPLVWRLRRAAWAGDAAATRRTAWVLWQRDGAGGARQKLLQGLDSALFGKEAKTRDLPEFARDFLARRNRT